jgi:hypothetical protein
MKENLVIFCCILFSVCNSEKRKTKSAMSYKLSFYTQYHQLYIVDSDSKDSDISHFGTNED